MTHMNYKLQLGPAH